MSRVFTMIAFTLIGLVCGASLSHSQSKDALQAYYSVEEAITRVGALEPGVEIERDRKMRAIAYLTLAQTELVFPGEYVIQ